MEREPDITINTIVGPKSYFLDDPKQAREFFDNMVVGPHGQTVGFFHRADGSQFWIKDMTDAEVVGYAYMCMRTILGHIDQ